MYQFQDFWKQCVSDNHDATNWYKIVIMEHVTIEKLTMLIDDLKKNI